MIKDSKGYIWSGGYYNLKCIDPTTNTVRLYPGVNSITAIAEKDSQLYVDRNCHMGLCFAESKLR